MDEIWRLLMFVSLQALQNIKHPQQLVCDSLVKAKAHAEIYNGDHGVKPESWRDVHRRFPFLGCENAVRTAMCRSTVFG
jgi:hypothetical protein